MKNEFRLVSLTQEFENNFALGSTFKAFLWFSPTESPGAQTTAGNSVVCLQGSLGDVDSMAKNHQLSFVLNCQFSLPVHPHIAASAFLRAGCFVLGGWQEGRANLLCTGYRTYREGERDYGSWHIYEKIILKQIISRNKKKNNSQRTSAAYYSKGKVE